MAKCFSLTGTTTCSPWSGSQLAQVSFSNQTINSVTKFDAYMANQMPGPSGTIVFANTFGCKSFSGEGLRYQQSFMCGFSSDVSTAAGCSTPKPPVLCKSVATAYLNSMTSVWKTACPNSNNAIPKDFSLFVARLPADDTGCILGAGSELSQCGFSTLSQAQAYCETSPSDSCCNSKVLGISDLPWMFTGSGVKTSTTTTVAVSTTSSVPSSTGQATSSSPASSAAASSNSSSSTTSNNLPIILGATLGGVAFIILVTFAIFYYKRTQGASPTNANSPLTPTQIDSIQTTDDLETLQVYYEYEPNMNDEIALFVGDKVLTKVKYDDGWAFGFNMTTKEEGSFPLACVGPIGTASIYIPEDNMRGTMYSNRMSSLQTTQSFA